MMSQSQTGSAAKFPLVIPTRTNTPTARLVVRNAVGQIVQHWLIRSSKCTLGSASDCGLCCKLPGIAPYHALIVVGARQSFVRALAPRVTRGGTSVTEILLVGESSKFEIAGHEFELSRQTNDLAQAATPERMKFSLARPMSVANKNTSQGSSPNAAAPLVVATPNLTAAQNPTNAPIGETNPEWIANLVKNAIAPLENQLRDVLVPIAALQAESKRRKQQDASNKRERQLASFRPEHSPDDSASTTYEGVGAEVARNLQEQLEVVTGRQAAAMDVITERISDVNSQLSAIERLVSEEKSPSALADLPAVVKDQFGVQAASIEQLQQGFVAVTQALTDLQNSQAQRSSVDEQWKSGIQQKLETLQFAVQELHDKSVTTAEHLSDRELEQYGEQLAAAQGALTATAQHFDLLGEAPIIATAINIDWSLPDTDSLPPAEVLHAASEETSVEPTTFSVEGSPADDEFQTRAAMESENVVAANKTLAQDATAETNWPGTEADSAYWNSNNQSETVAQSDFEAIAWPPEQITEDDAFTRQQELESYSLGQVDDASLSDSTFADDSLDGSQSRSEELFFEPTAFDGERDGISFASLNTTPLLNDAVEGTCDDLPNDCASPNETPLEQPAVDNNLQSPTIPNAIHTDFVNEHEDHDDAFEPQDETIDGLPSWWAEADDSLNSSESQDPWRMQTKGGSDGELELSSWETKSTSEEDYDAAATTTASPLEGLSVLEAEFATKAIQQAQTDDFEQLPALPAIEQTPGVSDSAMVASSKLTLDQELEPDDGGPIKDDDESQEFFGLGMAANPNPAPAADSEPEFASDIPASGELLPPVGEPPEVELGEKLPITSGAMLSADREDDTESDLADLASEKSLEAQMPVQSTTTVETQPNTKDESVDERIDASLSNAESAVANELLHATDQADDGEDESVEDYMQRLLARMRGEVPAAAEKPTSAGKLQPPLKPGLPANTAEVTSSTDRPERKKNVDSIRDTEASGSVNLLDGFEDHSQEKSTNSAAPELSDHQRKLLAEREAQASRMRQTASTMSVDLAAMRELANTSARHAIGKSTKRRILTSILLKVSVSIVGFLVAGTLIAINGFALNVGLIATFAAALVALIWGYDAFSTLPQLSNTLREQPKSQTLAETLPPDANAETDDATETDDT